ncbi:phosphopantetheine-binding protein [Kitasatospora sp. NBC_01250]|uniref:acyl carrier protein n=1 Tax=Kitasatospora sp. NBC_01250 TaxID=2903571 RepID=UPI002E3652A0|nr:phosphopantetheine-binding protein [Kitasatospora sp. NBC_01250]
MKEFTLEDVRRIMRSCAGEDDTLNLAGDILDVRFTELGYDSLALLEAAAVIERECGVELPDEGLHELDTPGKLIDFVGESLTVSS